MRHLQKLESWSHASGLRTVDLAAARTRGPRGGRLVIEHAMLQIDVQVDTGGAGALVGADIARLVSQFRVWDAAGDRRYLPGDTMLAWARAELGANHPRPPIGLAISQTDQLRTLWLVCPFLFERGTGRDDFCIGVDELQAGGGISVEQGVGAATIGTTGLVLDSAVFTMWLKTREDRPEAGSLRLRQRDEVVVQSQVSATSWRAQCAGKWLRGLYAYKRAVGGGADLAGMTDFTIEQLGMYGVSRVALAESFLMERPHLTSLDTDLDASEHDPVRAGKLVPIIYPARDEQFDDYLPPSTQDIVITANSNVATPDLIVHRVSNQAANVAKQVLAQNGIGKVKHIEADTAGKKDISKWGRQAPAIRKRVYG